jgi:hypothetical protein
VVPVTSVVICPGWVISRHCDDRGLPLLSAFNGATVVPKPPRAGACRITREVAGAQDDRRTAVSCIIDADLGFRTCRGGSRGRARSGSR